MNIIKFISLLAYTIYNANVLIFIIVITVSYKDLDYDLLIYCLFTSLFYNFIYCIMFAINEYKQIKKELDF